MSKETTSTSERLTPEQLLQTLGEGWRQAEQLRSAANHTARQEQELRGQIAEKAATHNGNMPLGALPAALVEQASKIGSNRALNDYNFAVLGQRFKEIEEQLHEQLDPIWNPTAPEITISSIDHDKAMVGIWNVSGIMYSSGYRPEGITGHFHSVDLRANTLFIKVPDGLVLAVEHVYHAGSGTASCEIAFSYPEE